MKLKKAGAVMMAAEKRPSSMYGPRIAMIQNPPETLEEMVEDAKLITSQLKADLLIQEVAQECGYNDQRYFASSFKKFYGCTPTQFKQAVEKEGLY